MYDEGMWDDETREILSVVQEGDIVILLFHAPCRLDYFHPHRIEIPGTGAFVSFICVPISHVIGDALSNVSLRIDFLSKHIPFLCPKIHILEVSITYSAALAGSFIKNMVFLSNPIRSKVHGHDSPEIIFMTTDWDYAAQSLEKAEVNEIEFGRELQKYHHPLERLECRSIEHFWESIQRVAGRLDRPLDESNSAGQDLATQIRRDAEDWRAKWVQQDIDKLYVELDKTPTGRLMRRRLKRTSEDQSKYLEPILSRMDDADLDEEERKTLEEKMEEEYALSRREFQRHFEIIQEMEIPIGRYLREFYNLPPPIEPKKKKRFVLF
ncbi:hypothetical protein NP233_g8261 [Leucocoprinus birnbaumii]|uniref:Uncharacterized protein n=1 Tax=Leucocoprinus birnbaumii TaxID=56174 RepID=A0AAD5YTW8_9AGAR|nr:hypothetical protein NP233_g8261 [Leucocoprinus birnbaumii]